METTFLDNRQIEWDEQKNRINIKKHGISLKVARLVFADPNRIEWYDEDHSDDEDRYKVLGKVGKILFVVYTERGESIRLISARLANAEERRQYYYGYT